MPSQLRGMYVASKVMGSKAGRALVQALQEGAWPHLRVRDVWQVADCVQMRGGGGAGVSIVEGGKTQHLDEGLRGGRSGPSRQAMARILGAVKRGACPRVKDVRMDASSVGKEWVQKLRDGGVEVERV